MEIKTIKLSIYYIVIIFSCSIIMASAAPIKIDPDDMAAIKHVANRAAIMADLDNDGLSDGLKARIAEIRASDYINVIVTFHGPVQNHSHVALAQQKVGDFKVQHKFTLIHGFAATMTAEQAQALAKIPDVFRVEEDPVVTTQLAGASSDFGAIAARTKFAVDGTGIGICIVDTGIDPNHEQFSGRSIGFYDAVGGKTTPYDDHGHGTHVAAIALGKGGNGANSNIKGVAPAASIFSVKALDATGSGSGSQIIAGIQFCAGKSSVQIISMSLGTASASDGKDAMSLAVNCVSDPSYSSSCNVTPVTPKIVAVAAGNSGPEPGTIGSPGAAEKAITVGAAANWSEDGMGVYLAAFSSRGPTLDNRIKPDIASPGIRILSAQAGTVTGYISYSGTSMATPFAAGSIALMVQKNPALKDNAVPADEVRKLLTSSAQDRGILETNSNVIKPDNEYGVGLLDVNRAIAYAAGNTDSVQTTSLPIYSRYTNSIARTGDQRTFGPFSITTDDISKGIPLAAALTVEGSPICPYGSPAICDLLGGWEWNPDFDLYLLNNQGNKISGSAGDLTVSECPLAGEYCGIGRQETIYYKPLLATAAGEYYIQVYSFSGSGNFLLEVSKGPLMSNTSPPANQPPVAEAGGPYFGVIPKGKRTVQVTLDGSNSKDPDGTIKSYIWTLTGNQIGSGQIISPSFKLGTYTVTLTVTDNGGLTHSDTATVTITK